MQSINELIHRYKILMWLVTAVFMVGFIIHVYGYAMRAEAIAFIGLGIVLAVVVFEMLRPISPMEKAYRLKRDFEDIPKEKREKLLMELARKDIPYARRRVADAVDTHFKDISKSVREDVLTALAGDEHHYVRSIVGAAIRYNFEDLPEELREKLLLKLADDRDKGERHKISAAGSEIALTVAGNFKDIPKDVREELLKKLAANDNPYTRAGVVFILREFGVPENLRSGLLKKLANDNDERVRCAVDADIENLRAKYGGIGIRDFLTMKYLK
ncbi:MAG: hypothetical protein A7316_09900 [Candidatus Altiarchaeales archaeon WOR_SM1_86-2]|nr:MAG: hypothetical protein A7316_09900 [Candidatus Altiarchaeales archaeon WOR_SM1_86-2]ODS37315.1 MAG: hypothetical protein A7315_04140 [Candidatus Altiarchaeales archaeon WOR_SM1_79]